MITALKIQDSINVEDLNNRFNSSPRRIQTLVDKACYFLSLISVNNDSFNILPDKDGFIPLCSELLNKILLPKEKSTILEALMDPNDPIVEDNGSWKNGSKCKGYRLTKKYLTGNNKAHPVGKSFAKKLMRIWETKKKEAQIVSAHLQPLVQQFDKHSLSLNPIIKDHLKWMGTRLLKELANNNQKQIVLNTIGRWLYFTETFNKSNIWMNISDKNRRLTSSFTNLPKYIRYYVQCNNEMLHGIDIKSSQPYILSTIMNNEFITGNGTYSLYNIYSDISKYSNNIMINGEHMGRSRASSYMCWPILTESDLQSIEQYRNAPFENDFYEYLVELKNDRNNIITRESLKKSFMFILFQDEFGHRNNDTNIKFFKSIYPGVSKWIEHLHKVIGSTRFAYLLQRIESYLILEKVGIEFLNRYPAAPLFTIHDCIYTSSEYVDTLERLIQTSVLNQTSVPVGTKRTETVDLSVIPQSQFQKTWNEIRSVKTANQFNKLRPSIFSSNIQRADNFLENM